jgi:hypothetical protein
MQYFVLQNKRFGHMLTHSGLIGSMVTAGVFLLSVYVYFINETYLVISLFFIWTLEICFQSSVTFGMLLM